MEFLLMEFWIWILIRFMLNNQNRIEFVAEYFQDILLRPAVLPTQVPAATLTYSLVIVVSNMSTMFSPK